MAHPVDIRILAVDIPLGPSYDLAGVAVDRLEPVTGRIRLVVRQLSFPAFLHGFFASIGAGPQGWTVDLLEAIVRCFIRRPFTFDELLEVVI